MSILSHGPLGGFAKEERNGGRHCSKNAVSLPLLTCEKEKLVKTSVLGGDPLLGASTAVP